MGEMVTHKTEPKSDWSNPDEMLSYEQVSKLLNVSKGTLYCWVHRQVIPHLRVTDRLVRFQRSALSEWLNQKRVSTPQMKGEV